MAGCLTKLEDLFANAFDPKGDSKGTKMKSSRPGVLSVLFVTAMGLRGALSNKENPRGSPGSLATNIGGIETGASCLRVTYLQ